MDATSIQIDRIPNNGSKKHKFAAIAAAIVLAVFLIFIFASYEGYVPFLKLSSSSTPYYSVANVQQLSSTVSKLQNSSGPFNLSYSLLLSLSATAGSSVFSFNLPINGYIAHYSPYTKETADIDLGALVKDIASLSSSINVSSFPKFLDDVNLTLLSNISYGTLCIPFSMIASAQNISLSAVGSSVNDSNINENSLLCVSLKTSNLTSSISSILSNNSANISNLSQFNNYIQVKYLKGESYNGNTCSLLDINTTPAFESKYNASMGFSFCFSNTYGVPLYGNFILNLTRDSSKIISLLNSSENAGGAPNFSNIILSASLKSAFNPAPASISGLSSLPAGSYTLNESMLLGMIESLSTPTITASSSGFSPFAIGSAVCNSTGTYLAGIVGGLPFGANNATFDNFTISSPAGFDSNDNFPMNGIISPTVVTPGSTFSVNFPEAKCSTAGAPFVAEGKIFYNLTSSFGTNAFSATGTIAGTSS
ncbi:hypothetical protein M1558_04415 [Candidatus Parvarchaeota archaeon]|nr:hypothetical protein [Candidatus Parvarchaeota archaeon]